MTRVGSRICISLALFAPLALGCQARGPALDRMEVVDLTHPIGPSTLFWPTGEPFELQVKFAGRTAAGYWYADHRFCSGEHIGTHLDAPYHFAERGQTVDEIPASKFVGPACVLDVSAKAEKDADYRASVEDLKAWEQLHGSLPEGAIVLVRAGWGKRWGDRRAYMGDDTPGDASRLHFPGLSRELAEFLVRERRIDAVGIDTASIDHGPSTDFIVHQILYAADIPGFENLANLERLPETGATIIALPARIEGASGAPLRAIALLP